MYKYIFILCILLLFLLNIESYPIYKLEDVYKGKILHGVYPGGFSGAEDDFSELDLISYERAVGKKVDFVYFSHNWYKSREFPKHTVDWIYKRGSVPYIRLMLRSGPAMASLEKLYTLDNINAGMFDEDLINWFKVARSYKRPMFVDFGVECNTDWFSWSGALNGGKVGPRKFRIAYRRIIDLSRKYGVRNILWTFHVDDDDVPNVTWNYFENYFPGDDYIDLFTVSIYGMLTPVDTEVRIFSKQLDKIYSRFQKLNPSKKVMVIEFGTTLNNSNQNQEEWAEEALTTIYSGKYENLIGFSWWNEAWANPIV